MDALFDWNRTKELSSKYRNSWACNGHSVTSKTVPDGTTDCNSTCTTFLRKYYGLRMRDMFVVGLHPDNLPEGPFLDSVPDMTTGVDAMLRVQRDRTCCSPIGVTCLEARPLQRMLAAPRRQPYQQCDAAASAYVTFGCRRNRMISDLFS